MQRFQCSVADDVYHIEWINIPVPVGAYVAVKGIVAKSNDYTVVNSTNERRLRDELASVNRRCKTTLSMDQYISLQSILLKQKAMNSYRYVARIIGTITDKYNSRMNIIKLSKKYGCPPSYLLKSIFICQGYDELSINKVFRHKMNYVDVLSLYDQQQYNLAEKCDSDSMTHQIRIAKIAADNEALFVGFFRGLGIKLSTQEELIDEQMKTYGRAVVTPDILFVDQVFVNGVQIHWLEYKDYMCTDTRYLWSKNVSQVERYINQWGTGAICYNHSFVENMVIPGALVLDATALGIEFVGGYQ